MRRAKEAEDGEAGKNNSSKPRKGQVEKQKVTNILYKINE